jgi:hypothetical protein
MTRQPNERGRPPRDDEGRAPTDPTNVQEVDSHTNGLDYIAGIRRRRAAKHRVPVQECGRHADPWPCRCYDTPESPERNAAGYRAAARHLIKAGLLPAPNLGAMRTMWRLDVENRELARYIAERWQGVA